MQENKEDKLSHWRLHEYLTITEASALWIDEEPPWKWNEEFQGPHPLEDNASFRIVRNAIASAIEQDKLKTARYEVGWVAQDGVSTWPHYDRTTIKREELARWALSKEERPSFLVKDIERLEEFDKSLEEIAPFLDKSHPHFPRELEIAAKAWMALYEKGEERGRKSHKDYIKDWLKKNYPDLTNNAAERIATVVNPDKKGGAPSQ